MKKELTPEQVELLTSCSVNAVLATADRAGNPNTAPVHLMWAKDINTIIVALATRHQSSDNLKTQGRFSLSVMEADDQAFSVQGYGKLVRQPMDANPHMSMFELTVQVVKPDTTPTVAVVSGVRTKKRSEKTDTFFTACFQELKAF
ncbi:MAG: pyridoxamine 5'-phosphate oxidase family protein [Firmicutes bacterium]|nr:pyridoxamine 5'-phosphate oxidase family protein [Bacillota bacterium]